MRGLPKLTIASARMIYRSPASLRVAFMTPLIFAAVIALFHQLRFETAPGRSTSSTTSPSVPLSGTSPMRPSTG